MQIDAQGIHRHDFRSLRAAQLRERRLELLGIPDPWRSGLLVPEHAEPLPFRDLSRDALARAERRQAQRMAAQIQQRLAIAVARTCETRLQCAQRIACVLGTGPGLVCHTG